MTRPGDYVTVVNTADGMENGQLIRVRDVDKYGRFHLFGFDGPWNPERFKDAPSYTELAARVEVLERENKILELKCQHSLANNICPDHRDKQCDNPCLACVIERLTTERDQARKAILSYGNGAEFDWNVLGRIDDLERERNELLSLVQELEYALTSPSRQLCDATREEMSPWTREAKATLARVNQPAAVTTDNHAGETGE